MTKRPKSPRKGKSKTARARTTPPLRPLRAKAPRATARRDPLEDFVQGAAHALDLKLEPAWKAAVKTNLEITLHLASLFADFPLPDDAEPAPVFSA
jgi:hypothetical protein